MQQHPLYPKEGSFFKALRASCGVQLQITAAVTRCYPAVLTDSFAKGLSEGRNYQLLTAGAVLCQTSKNGKTGRTAAGTLSPE